ncbi:hypothetical protein I317_02536 [Kwoniella heveanensis CBS 569]|nr:hypothetical protein I317_02536 [Kwoniella heveanensis CBS 569]
MITYGGGTRVAINCTGTGVTFDLSYARLNGAAFKPSILINNTSPGSTNGAKSNATSVTNLPLGHHTFELSFDTSDTAGGAGSAAPSGSTARLSKDNWVRVNGATCVSGTKVGKDTKHGTIDDSAWRDWKVSLSPGWNMIETGESNFFDATLTGTSANATGENKNESSQAMAISSQEQYRAELPTTTRDWNNSISWTEQAGVSTGIRFTGSAAWVYGIVGGQAGTYEVTLDDVSQGIFNATAGERVYDQLLYQAANLEDGPHTITLINVQEGRRLSFDRLVAMSGLELVNPPASAPSTSAQPSQSISQVPVATYYPTSSPNAASSEDASATILTGGAIAGITIAGILVVVFILSVVGFTLRRRREEEHREGGRGDGAGGGGGGGLSEKPVQTTFWRFSSRSISPEKAHPFHPLASPPIPLTASTATTSKSPYTPQSSQHLPVPDKPPFFHHFQSSSAKAKHGHSRSTSNAQHARADAEAHSGGSQDASASALASGTDTGQQSFLKISGKKAHHRKTSLSYKKGQHGHGLIISKPQPDDAGDYANVPPGTSTSLATSTSPSMYSEAQSTTPTGTFGNMEPMPPLPTQHQRSKNNAQEAASGSNSGNGNGLPGRPLLQARQSTLDPLSAALSGNVSSPLAELSRKTSVIRNSAHPHGKNISTNTNSQLNRISKIFGRRKGSLAESLDTRKWEVETDFGTEAAFDGNGNDNARYGDSSRDSGGEGILSMYAKFPPGPVTPHTSALEPQLAAGHGQVSGGARSASRQSQNQNPNTISQLMRDKDIVGLALGSPMEDSPDPWGEQVRQKKRKTQEEEERKMRAKQMMAAGSASKLKDQARATDEREMVDILPDEEDLQPPTRRFFGKAFGRPVSGTSMQSGKSASSVGSGWRYM